MSIAEDEAEKAYPTLLGCDSRQGPIYSDTDYLQEAYLRGRLAPPAGVEVEAVAKRLLWLDMAWEYDIFNEDDLWNRRSEQTHAMYLKVAREILEIARKAVDE